MFPFKTGATVYLWEPFKAMTAVSQRIVCRRIAKRRVHASSMSLRTVCLHLNLLAKTREGERFAPSIARHATIKLRLSVYNVFWFTIVQSECHALPTSLSWHVPPCAVQYTNMLEWRARENPGHIQIVSSITWRGASRDGSFTHAILARKRLLQTRQPRNKARRLYEAVVWTISTRITRYSSWPECRPGLLNFVTHISTNRSESKWRRRTGWFVPARVANLLLWELASGFMEDRPPPPPLIIPSRSS